MFKKCISDAYIYKTSSLINVYGLISKDTFNFITVYMCEKSHVLVVGKSSTRTVNIYVLCCIDRTSYIQVLFVFIPF